MIPMQMQKSGSVTSRKDGQSSPCTSPTVGCRNCPPLLRRLLDLDHTGEKDLEALPRDQLCAELNSVLEADKSGCVDLNTKFWYFSLQAQKRNHDRTFRGIAEIGAPKPKRELVLHKLEGLPALRLPDNDEDDLDGTAYGIPSTLVKMLLFWLPRVDEPTWFDTAVEGILTFQKVFVAECISPPPIETFEELSSDEAMSLIAFTGIGQVLLQGVDGGFEIDTLWLGDFEVRPGFEKYGCRAAFGADQTIQSLSCRYNDSEVRPGDEDWEHAKWMFKASLGVACQLSVHLVQVHWGIANSTHVACREQLREDHPIRKVLKVFIFNTGAINLSAANVLFPEHAWLSRTFAFTYPSLLDLFRKALTSFSFQTFPAFLEAKNLGPAQEEVPIAVDGLPIWRAFHSFFREYLDLFYADEAAITADGELAAYWECIDRRGGAPYSDEPGLPRFGLPSLSKAALIDQLTHHAFSVTAWHELIGSLVQYSATPLGVPYKVRPGREIMDVQTFVQGNLLIAMTGLRQPCILSAWDHLLPEEPAEARRLQHRLVKELQCLSAEVDQRNSTAPCQKRRRKVEFFNPRHFECSVSA